MVTTNRITNNSADQLLKNRIARVVFSVADTSGLSDRAVVEQMTGQVIDQVIDKLSRIEPFPGILPGMEHLVKVNPGQPAISDAEIHAKVQEVLANVSDIPLIKASAPTQPPVIQTATETIGLSPNARLVLERRYLTKDDLGQPDEAPEELFRRVAHHIASAELVYDSNAATAIWEEEFYRVMTALEFLPNSPTLMNAGRKLGQLSACFVLPIEDSIESIFDAVKYTAMIHKSGGGTGFSFSRIRPEQDRVGSTGGVASGPVSFMGAFDSVTDVIKQGGMRRGANMGILNVDHPDIMSFVKSKENHDVLNNFNISVAVTDSFMEALKQDTSYDLINPRTREVSGQLVAREVFNTMVDMAWRNGDPGMVFIDRINKDNPTPHLGTIESTNPCGEQPLLPFESCNLGSINLSRMVTDTVEGPAIDWEKLGQIVRISVRFLDNVIDVNKFPLPEIEKMTKSTRKIGLGVMGFADMLIKLGIPYNDKGGVVTAGKVMEFIEKESLSASEELASERGVFPAFKGSIYDNPGKPQVRNATRTTIAPTGTLSIIAGCSSGIEPLFALSYFRNILDGDQLVEVNPLFEEIAKKEGFYSEEIMKTLAENGTAHDVEGIPEQIKQVFVTAHDINPECHIKMQSAFQKYTDNAVSKTINFPHSATIEDVSSTYLRAYEEGCKGITIYRDRSRDAQVLAIGKEKSVDIEGKVTPRVRPDVTFGVTAKMTTGCGNLYITVNSDERGICEIFTSLGKSGGCASAQLEAISRLISMSLRAGVSVESLIKHIKGIRCPSIAWDRGHAVLSCADAVGTVLEQQLHHRHPQTGGGITKLSDSNDSTVQINSSGIMGGQCPECSGLLVYQEGCHICYGCGYTKCS